MAYFKILEAEACFLPLQFSTTGYIHYLSSKLVMMAKGKGKDCGKGNSKGKEKTTNEESRGRPREKELRLPKAIFYEDFPDKAKGQQVCKCPKSGCYGCCLVGARSC